MQDTFGVCILQFSVGQSRHLAHWCLSSVSVRLIKQVPDKGGCMTSTFYKVKH